MIMEALTDFLVFFYSRIPGVELSQSKTYFEKAISSNEAYFGNQVQMSEFYYQKSEDKTSFLDQLKYVNSLDASSGSFAVDVGYFKHNAMDNPNLKLGAVLTNDNLDELDRFDARCRLSPGIIPEAMALIVNKTSPQC